MFLRATKRFKDGKVHLYWSMVKNALLFLKSVASNPPDDRLTAAEEHEIDEQFSIF